MNKLLFLVFIVLILASPLPLGSNREWSWSLGALLIAGLSLIWVGLSFRRQHEVQRFPSPLQTVLFLTIAVWTGLQVVSWVPDNWHHPLWQMTEQSLGTQLAGSVSLAPEETLTALMRLLSYVLVFTLAIQLGRDPYQARVAFGWIVSAGLAYSAFGLYVYWSGNHPEWLFGDRVLAHDVRSSFINRNHFATWVGLTLICAIAHFYQFLSVPEVKAYSIPQDRPARVEEFILRAWKPMAGLLIMVTALILTHSRGGFLSTLAAVVTLLLLLDRRGSERRALSRVTIIFAVAVASIAFYMTSEVLLDRINRTDISKEERLAVYDNVNQAIGDNPALGFGYGTFSESFRLYDKNETPVHYDRAHNTWLENIFELGVPAALMLYASVAWVVFVCLRGINRRRREWIYPAAGVAASVLVGLHALVDFSLQIPAVAILYAAIMGIAYAQSYSTVRA